MTDPIMKQQLEDVRRQELSEEILRNSRQELYMEMRFLDVALNSFHDVLDEKGSIGTDGEMIYYYPEYLFSLYRTSRVRVNRTYLHMVLHCLFGHLFKTPPGNHSIPSEQPQHEEQLLWMISCDMAIESMIDDLYLRCVHVKFSLYRRQLYERMKKSVKVMTAEAIYHILKTDLEAGKMSEEELSRMAAEFQVDSHHYWRTGKKPPSKQQMLRQKWDDIREKSQTNLETFGKEDGENSKSMLEQIKVENRERYDYKKFLKKFSVLKEETQIDPDSFDYIYYTYGMNLYGNMPLIEPQETREVFKIEDFVIVIDTSMSCSGELVKKFLEETYRVLTESESYFKKVRIHIIQCDEQIQSDQLITNVDEMKNYMDHFQIVGQGGTDFRPAFEYVNQLITLGEFKKLRGLLYFTDGKGIYPAKMPHYDTAFIFMADQYQDFSVPAWAMKLVIEEEI